MEIVHESRIECLEYIAKKSEEYLYWLDKVANGNLDITEMNSLHLSEHSLIYALKELKEHKK